MTSVLRFFLFLTSAVLFSSFSSGNKGLLQYDGFYIAQTGQVDIPGNPMPIYTYLRFYEDRTVITQAVSSLDPEAVSKWLDVKVRYERMGRYSLKSNRKISFVVNNDGTEDKKLEGARTNSFEGSVENDGSLRLLLSFNGEEGNEHLFKFYPFLSQH